MGDNDIDPRLYQAMLQQQMRQQDALRFQLDPADELHEFKTNLLGQDYNEETGRYEPSPHKKPLINSKGGNMVITFATPRLSKLSSLSNMDEDDIKNRALRFEEDMEWALCRHQHEFNIPSFPVQSLISGTVGDLNFSTSMRSIGGWEGDGIRKQQTIVESKETITENKPKQPLYINPFRGGGK